MQCTNMHAFFSTRALSFQHMYCLSNMCIVFSICVLSFQYVHCFFYIVFSICVLSFQYVYCIFNMCIVFSIHVLYFRMCIVFKYGTIYPPYIWKDRTDRKDGGKGGYRLEMTCGTWRCSPASNHCQPRAPGLWSMASSVSLTSRPPDQPLTGKAFIHLFFQLFPCR